MTQLEYIATGTYGLVMKETINKKSHIIKQQYYNNDIDNIKNTYEVLYSKKAYTENPDIFIKIIRYEVADFNRADTIKKKVPITSHTIDTGWFQYIYSEYMDLGDLFKLCLTKTKDLADDMPMLNIINILGCYFNGLYILHNKLNIIHGDITASNMLVKYIGPGYKQKIIYEDKEYFLNADCYMFKICDFGIAEPVEDLQINNNMYSSHIFRDYLLLYFLYFIQQKYGLFLYYDLFNVLIEETIIDINTIILKNTHDIDKYDYHFNETYTYSSVCKYFNKFHNIDTDTILYKKLPVDLLNEFLELYKQYME